VEGRAEGEQASRTALCLAAHPLHRSSTPLGDYLRWMKARLGRRHHPTAHKIVNFYTMIGKRVEYDDTLWAAHDAERDRRLEAKLKLQAHRSIEHSPAA
jgi:hypothetical protein